MKDTLHKNVLFDNFSVEDSDWSGACGTDFIMYENPRFIAENRHPYKMDRTFVIFCTGGNASGKVNLREYDIVKDGLLVVLPNHIVEMESVSDDFRAFYIISSEAFQSSLDISGAFQLHREMEQTPWRQFSGRTLDSIKGYFSMCRDMLDAADNPNRLEIIRLMTKAFFLGFGYYLHQYITPETLGREERISKRFLTMVEQNYTRIREVGQYADRMAISPKYLSMSVKASTGKTPGQWIGNYITLDARAQLASTRKTILQISDELGFATQSEFGRYFKRIVGMSPKAYRESLK